MAKVTSKYVKSFNNPDEKRNFQAHGHVNVVNFEKNMIVGQVFFEPGWKWSKDVAPIAGTSSCQEPHLGYCLSGKITVKLDNGEEFQIQAGDTFYIPPGHDGWVEGNEPFVSLDFIGMKEYAKQKKAA